MRKNEVQKKSSKMHQCITIINIQDVFATYIIEIVITHTNWQQQINEQYLVVNSMQYTLAVDNPPDGPQSHNTPAWRPTFF